MPRQFYRLSVFSDSEFYDLVLNIDTYEFLFMESSKREKYVYCKLRDVNIESFKPCARIIINKIEFI